MSSERTQKADLDRELLKNHGIRFRERTTTADKLEPLLQRLFHFLTHVPDRLDRFPRDMRDTFREELKRFSENGQDRNSADRENWCLGPVENTNQSHGRILSNSAVKKTRNKFAAYQQVAYDVQQYRAKKEMEPKWTSILTRHIFVDFPKVDGESNSWG